MNCLSFLMLPFFNGLLFEIALYYTKHAFLKREALSYQIQRIMNLQNKRMLTASSFHAWNAYKLYSGSELGLKVRRVVCRKLQTLVSTFFSVFYVFTCSLQKIVGNLARKLKPTNMNLVMLFVMQVCDA